MAKMESFWFMASLVGLGLSAVLYIWQFGLLRRQQIAPLAGGALQATWTGHRLGSTGRLGTMIAVVGLVFLTLSIIARWVTTGHGPFANMYEFSIAMSWGIVVASLYFQWRYRTPIASAVTIPIAVAFMVYAYMLPSRPVPLVPALQQSLLLTFHVAVAMIAYGVFAIGFGAGVLYLVQRRANIAWLPSAATLDDMGYKSVIIGFPFMTLVLVLGALWADIAWGKYWSWDPKETATLVTWFIYGGYLHARTLRGWTGTRTAVLLLVGFGAVVFTYLGNYFFSGLHSYG